MPTGRASPPSSTSWRDAASRRSAQIDVGPTVVVGYYDQLGVKLDLQARVQELVAGPHRTPGSLPDVELMKRFLFTGELPFARVGTLSGGERRRLQLLLVIAGRPNVLFLDEPTNDLDLDTLRILEDFLEEWPGALVVVSHDRTFLERTTDRLVAVGAGGTVSGVPGGVDGWIARIEGGDARRAGSLPSSTATSGETTEAATSRHRLRVAWARTQAGVDRYPRTGSSAMQRRTWSNCSANETESLKS